MYNSTVAGLFDDHCELIARGDRLYGAHQGRAVPFAQLPAAIKRKLSQALDDDPDAVQALDEWGIDNPPDRLEQFAWCRFGGVDVSPDMTSCGKLTPDYHECGARGRCPFEGRICVNKHRLTRRERQLLICIASGKPQKVIADDFGTSEVTVAKQRKSLFNKTGAQSSVELTRFAVRHNYISRGHEE